jgi:tetratricopeptide (TPR) repeat protein
MKNRDIIKNFLILFSKDWNDPAAHQGFRELRDKVSNKDNWLRQLIVARIMALEKNIGESIAILKDLLDQNPGNYLASLLLARIMSREEINLEGAIEIYESLLSVGFQEQVFPDWLEALTLANKTYALALLKRNEELFVVVDHLIERFNGSQDCLIVLQCVRAMINKGWALGQMSRYSEAIQTYEKIVDIIAKIKDESLNVHAAWALVNKSSIIGKMGKHEEAIRLISDIVKQLDESTDGPFQEQVSMALVNKGEILGWMKKDKEAIEVYDEVITRFGQSNDVILREQVAKALNYKGMVLAKSGDSDSKEALLIYEDVVKRFGEMVDLPIREQVARALLYKAEYLININHIDEASVIFKYVGKEYLSSEVLKARLTSDYTDLYSRLASSSRQENEQLGVEQSNSVLDITRTDLAANLRVYLTDVLRLIDPKKQEEYFNKIKDAKNKTDRFIYEDSHFSSERSFLLILREWNSYTPVIPGQEESDRGGGYFIKHFGEGIVIDPGYDFIENFYRAGGRLCDIDHVIVTHAHDDHTAELEALLMLLQKRWISEEIPNKKQISLYLSTGVQRKFGGIIDLRDPKYKRIITLCSTDKGFEQRISINLETELTILPAYHDDIITQKTAVGLAFEFTTKKGKRQVVFTGDSGLYPLKIQEDGERRFYDDDLETPMLDVTKGKALYQQYPDNFMKPELLIAHIGSIKESEFRPQDISRSRDEDVGRWYYVNHLGLLGTLIMLHQLKPRASVISEFGSELKGFHFELVDKLRQALHQRQIKDGCPECDLTFVVPGDLTIVYDIVDHCFLDHSTCEFKDPKSLGCIQAIDYTPEWSESTNKYRVKERRGNPRTYLLGWDKINNEGTHIHNQYAENYHNKLYNNMLLYHKGYKL